VPNPNLISEEELRAAGAFDVPESWRKSLKSEKSLFDMASDDDSSDEEPESKPKKNQSR
jgi:hypothetical protein